MPHEIFASLTKWELNSSSSCCRHSTAFPYPGRLLVCSHLGLAGCLISWCDCASTLLVKHLCIQTPFPLCGTYKHTWLCLAYSVWPVMSPGNKALWSKDNGTEPIVNRNLPGYKATWLWNWWASMWRIQPLLPSLCWLRHVCQSRVLSSIPGLAQHPTDLLSPLPQRQVKYKEGGLQHQS